MVDSRLCGFIAALGIILGQCVSGVPIGSAINSVFLHINNVSVDCSEDLGRMMPYNDALLECAHDINCCVVVVEEVDAHSEAPGMSRLCASCNLLNARSVKNARVSIKGHQSFIAKDFDVMLNQQGVCERDQLLGELVPVLSSTTAARECGRTDCDYFTMATLEGIENLPGTVNKAWFCSGDAKTVPAEGFITAVRKRRNYEL
ncbi:hypothetical protein, conserved [Babesia bigemina]|uniref:Uncharacterized protein n=1 Tax=Babesia bigemina TaxID=5866 RepID=A0A061D0Y1_BABBI|nr:hypothetical protein, conserved [Babesia bigemina]CDR94283.1 hypothetical protein, conserved [Babesia bigemina]|eukprot:XP_012766469.1 hypothetical protein, conserved [Babesia bigemina]